MSDKPREWWISQDWYEADLIADEIRATDSWPVENRYHVIEKSEFEIEK